MKKEQKIIELRTAAKCKVAEIETKIAFVRSEAAGKRARLMWERAAELEGLEVTSMERFDVLAKYRTKLAGVNEQLTAMVAQLKYEISKAKTECEKECAAAEDDPEPEKPQDCDQTTQWLNGEQWTAAVVARRILRKLPTIPYNCSIDIAINHYTKDMISLQVNSYNPNRKGNAFEEILMNGCESKEQQVEAVDGWFKKTEELFAFKPDNDRVAEPIARALDAIWGGGDPVSELNDIVDGVARKEEDNE